MLIQGTKWKIRHPTGATRVPATMIYVWRLPVHLSITHLQSTHVAVNILQGGMQAQLDTLLDFKACLHILFDYELEGVLRLELAQQTKY